VALLAQLAERLKVGRRQRVFWSAFVLAFLALLACFGRAIGFNPPMNEMAPLPTALLFVLAPTGLLLWAIMRISGRHQCLADLLIVVGLLPVCFVATQPPSLADYSYILAPALRLVDHFKLSEIYFQYDLLLSLFAAAWMKLRLDLNYFQVVAQVSFYALFLGSFFASRRFFRVKKLSYYLLAALVLVKAYGLVHDPALALQVAPLRLDLWIVLFVLAYEKGIYSKWLGVALGALVVFHRTFGVIYALGYLELILTLWLLDGLRRPASWRALKDGFRKHLALVWPNALIVLSALALSGLLFGGLGLEAASTYRSLGIGFLPIDRQSFYWYVPVLLSVAFVLFLRKRKLLDEKYFHGGLFLIFLAVGESLYFFGRSNENYLIDISAVLLLVLFALLDLVFSEGPGPARSGVKKKLTAIVPALLVLAVAFCYSGRIHDRLAVQFQNVQKGRLIYPLPVQVGPNVLLPVVGDSQKVYFLGAEDFYYYYYWGYVPQGRFSPYNSWIYEKDLVSFVQGLLNDGYFVAVPQAEVAGQQEIISGLRYDHEVQQDGWRVMWRSSGKSPYAP
jgi:hypothetical protein